MRGDVLLGPTEVQLVLSTNERFVIRERIAPHECGICHLRGVKSARACVLSASSRPQPAVPFTFPDTPPAFPSALPTCFAPPRAQVVAGHASPRVLSCAPTAVMGTSSPVTAAQAKRGWWKPAAAPRRTSPRSHDPNGRAVAPSASTPSPVGVIGVAAVTGQPSKADLRSLGGRTRLPRPRNARVASRRFVPAVGTGAFFVRAGHAMRAGLADSPGASGAR